MPKAKAAAAKAAQVTNQHSNPSTSHIISNGPVSLTQPNVMEGYLSSKRMFMIAASFVTIVGCFYWCQQTYDGITFIIMVVALSSGIMISDRTLWKLGEATEHGEVHNTDVRKVMLLKLTCYADIFFGMTAKGMPLEFQNIYFQWGIPFFTVLIFVQWEFLIHYGERAKNLAIDARIAVSDFLSEKKVKNEETNNRIAAREEKVMVEQGKRDLRLETESLFINKMITELNGRQGKDLIASLVKDKLQDMLDPNSGGDSAGNKTQLQHVVQFNVNPTQTKTTTRRKRKRTTCKGCGKDLPSVGVHGEAWEKDYCLEADPAKKDYGGTKAACRTKYSRSKA